LGIATNNQARGICSNAGFSIIIILGIRELIVIGDSRIIIKSLTHKEPPKDSQLALTLSMITKHAHKLAKIILSCLERA
jgi:hypothetical protein